jgi:hypothetical protein
VRAIKLVLTVLVLLGVILLSQREQFLGGSGDSSLNLQPISSRPHNPSSTREAKFPEIESMSQQPPVATNDAGSQSARLSELFAIKPSEEILSSAAFVSEDAKARVRRNVATIQRGEPIIEDGSVPGLEKQFKAMSNRVKPLPEIVDRLTRVPSDVSDTPLRDAPLLGAYMQGTLVKKSWTGVGRVFRHPELGIVVLDEYDLFASSAKQTMAAETMNFPIGDQPGWFSVRSDPRSGLSVSRLKWVDNSGVAFELIIQRSDEAAKQAMRQIAESIKP